MPFAPNGGGRGGEEESLSNLIAKTRAAKKEARDARASKLEGGWNSTPHRPVPYALRGSKPITDEPWARDNGINGRDADVDPAALPRDAVLLHGGRKAKSKRQQTAPDGRPAWDSSKSVHF